MFFFCRRSNFSHFLLLLLLSQIMLFLLFSKLWHKATFSAMAILATYPLSSLKNHDFMKACSEDCRDDDEKQSLMGSCETTASNSHLPVAFILLAKGSFQMICGFVKNLDLQRRWQRWCHQVKTGYWITEVSAGQWPSWPSEKMHWMNVSTLSH